ncbi:RagB/SusD family nutrient uptake outer membrane protein [Algoriphagus resistens]|uniref:RagB/SusD family nutrient uptake outer membrane protein n=1 Tax=Algoriphagus resistens TaxID=1750590 RepID=UPI000716A640|nr:RagB/SusD family nutrient uptake outer membrane protein [Algoriphagus resistens]
MKNILIGFVFAFLASSCVEEFNEIPPKGVISSESLATEEGVDLLLIGAYSMLDQLRPGITNDYYSTGDKFWYGIMSDEAHKGGDNGDLAPLFQLSMHNYETNNPFILDEWKGLYAGVNRANLVIAQAELVEEVDLTTQIAEARFLRAHFNFNLTRSWGNVVYLGPEDIYETNKPNDGPLWDQIEEDFQFAIENLPPTQGESGRANQWSAKAYLGKVYLYEQKYTEAATLLQEVVESGPYQLLDEFTDNFGEAGKAGTESVFAIQFQNDDGQSFNGNRSFLWPLAGGPLGTCCGFYQPTQDLVNAYQTDASGLPLLDTYNLTDIKNDQGLPSFEADGTTPTPFTVHSGPVDPRLDFTVGRRDLDWNGFGRFVGMSWVRAQVNGGPYATKKFQYRAWDIDANRGQFGQFERPGIHYQVIRYADVLLMAAEALVESGGSLMTALDYVNQVRNRANQSTYVPTIPGVNPTNYHIEPYPNFPDVEYARKAVRFERRLELATEGHRWFDLSRYGADYYTTTMNSFFKNEARTIQGFENLTSPALPKHAILPIPLSAIDLSNNLLKQNPGW